MNTIKRHVFRTSGEVSASSISRDESRYSLRGAALFAVALAGGILVIMSAIAFLANASHSATFALALCGVAMMTAVIAYADR
jgi:hypothetical protein